MKELKDLKLKENKKILDLNNEDLIKEYKESKRKLFVLEMKLESNELKQTHLLKVMRRYIAKIATAIRQNEIKINY